MILEILNHQKWGGEIRTFLDFYIWFLMSSQIYISMTGIYFFIYGLDKFG